MDDLKKQANRDVLKKLIAMCQQMMVDGMGDDESAGADVKDKLGDELDEDPKEEAMESPAEEKVEDDAEGDDAPLSLQDHIRAEMKKGKRSPVKADRSVAVMVARPGSAMKAAGKGRY